MRLPNRLTALIFALPLALAAHITAAPAQELELLEPGELSVATDGAYPPFDMTNDQGELDGIDVRLTREIARRLGLEYKPLLVKFESVLIGLEAGQYDMIGEPLDITAERKLKVTFSDGWIESGARLIVQKDSPVQETKDIEGKVIGVLAASTWADLATPLKPSELKTYKTEIDAMQDLVNGNIDAIITDGIAASYNIKKSNLPLRLVQTPLSNLQKAWTFKKGKPNLVNAVNKALAEMIADGTYEKLTADFIDFNAAPKDPIRSEF